MIENFTRNVVPYLLYLRKFDLQVLHGADDSRRTLLETHLLEEVTRLGANMVSVQEPGAASYTQAEMAFSRRAPALLLGQDEWGDYVRPLISDADLIVSECLMVSAGVRAELDFAFRSGVVDRWRCSFHPPDPCSPLGARRRRRSPPALEPALKDAPSLAPAL